MPSLARLCRALTQLPNRLAPLAIAAAAFACLPVTAALATDGRAYELVTPPDKGGFPLSERDTVQSSPSGDAVAYASTGAFGGAGGSLVKTFYVGRRSESGWGTHSATGPQTTVDSAALYSTRFFSDSLDSAMQFSRAGTVPGSNDGGSNLYRLDVLSGAQSLLATGVDDRMTTTYTNVNALVNSVMAGTPDLSSFVFESETPLLPEAAPGSLNVYEVADGELRLVNYLPDGSVSPAGGTLRAGPAPPLFDATGSHPISADGRRVFFNMPAGANGALYMRIDGTTTVPLSLSRRPGDPDTPVRANFVGASDDGTKVYFTSDFELTTDANPGAFENLYRLDTTTDELTLVNPLLDPANDTAATVGRSYGVSPDGSSVYFLTLNKLTPDGTAFAGLQVYAYKHGEGLRRVTGTGNELPLQVRMSDSGRYLTFATAASDGSFDNTDPSCQARTYLGIYTFEGTCLEVYRYDSATGERLCPTCIDGGGRNGHSAALPDGKVVSGYKIRSVLDDGTVFFTSEEALVPGDVNGKRDAYRWKDGVFSLISSGRSSHDSWFSDASPDGRDVFFMTRERLVAADTDDELDLYDARVGGGIAAQQVSPPRPPSCDGDGCQGGLQSGPLVSAIGSLGLDGAGDVANSSVGRVSASLVASSARRASFTVRVTVPGRGRVLVSGPGLRRVSKRTTRAGTVRLRLTLTRGARERLASRDRIRVRANVVFMSAAGRRTATAVALTLKVNSKSKAGSK